MFRLIMCHWFSIEPYSRVRHLWSFKSGHPDVFINVLLEYRTVATMAATEHISLFKAFWGVIGEINERSRRKHMKITNRKWGYLNPL